MADLYWKGGDGATDPLRGDFNTAANWQTITGGAGAVPGAADRMIFDGRAGLCDEVLAGKHTLTKHWNCYGSPGDGPDDCQGVVISANFTGRVGIASDDVQTPIQLSLAAGKKLVYKGNEPACFKIKTAAKLVPLVVHDSESGLLILSGVNDTNAVWTLIECYGAGTLDILDDTKVTDLYNYGTTTITIGESCPACNIYQIGAGTISVDSPVGTVRNHAGSMTIGQVTLTTPEAALDIADGEVYAGMFTWRSAGKWTAGKQYGGTILMVGGSDKVIGNNADIFLLKGGTFDCTGQDGDITFGSGCSIMIKGGELKLPDGTKITAMSTGN